MPNNYQKLLIFVKELDPMSKEPRVSPRKRFSSNLGARFRTKLVHNSIPWYDFA